MKTAKKNIKLNRVGQFVVNATIDENKKHPYLEQKLEEANKVLKRVGLPKELVH